MSYSGPVTLYQRDGWPLESYGKGAAYRLCHDLPFGRTESCFIQGDDADIFRAEAFDGDGWLVEGDVCAVPRLHCLFQEYLSVMERDQ